VSRALCDRCGLPSRSRGLMQGSLAYARELPQKARVDARAREPPHPIVGQDAGVGSAHAYATFAAALSPLLPMPCMGGTPVVMSSVRTDLPGSSRVEPSLGFFPGIVRRVHVIHGPGAYPVDLHHRFLLGPGKMGGLGLHNGHTPGG